MRENRSDLEAQRFATRFSGNEDWIDAGSLSQGAEIALVWESLMLSLPAGARGGIRLEDLGRQGVLSVKDEVLVELRPVSGNRIAWSLVTAGEPRVWGQAITGVTSEVAHNLPEQLERLELPVAIEARTDGGNWLVLDRHTEARGELDASGLAADLTLMERAIAAWLPDEQLGLGAAWVGDSPETFRQAVVHREAAGVTVTALNAAGVVVWSLSLIGVVPQTLPA
ncbi:hypothetical protein, partial [Arachnia propionica]|uniref:hypothetical protein n=1 Tax=Arachnia propionica TaxID=1750 RepID=UPI001352081F